MHAVRFDRFTRALTTQPSRRIVLQGLVATVLGLAPGSPPRAVHARKRKKTVKRNEFGCVNVGKFCKRHDQCCSSICRGKKPKQGARDRSRCVAHDAAGCQAGQQGSFCGGANVACTTTAGIEGVCDTTTGNAGYCAFTTTCSPCRKDADCRPVCGPGAACVKCATCSEEGGTRCVGIGPDACIFD